MAETSLRRLVNIGTFTVLQDKLERWLSNYYINTTSQNIDRGCEIIELNAKVQGQLFRMLSLCASEGGMYRGSEIIRSRLTPWLGDSFFTKGIGESALSFLEKDREISTMKDLYETNLEDLERELEIKDTENAELRDELLDTKDELNRSMRSSTSDKMFTEVEVRELRRKLTIAEDEVRNLRSKAGLLGDLETQVQRLRDDISLLTSRRDSLLRGPPSIKDDSYIRSAPLKSSSLKSSVLSRDGDIYDSLNTYRYTPRVGSPLSIDDPVQRVRQQNLISRWNDMFSQDRLDAMDTLRRYSDDYENNQRIIFTAMQEAFSIAKLAFRQFKMKVRANLAGTHLGPETLEEAVQDYINRNTDLYDLPGMVSDVIRAMNRSPKIFLPPDSTFAIIQPFIREAVKLAWQKSALAHPMDISVASDAELFDANKYRRSYDSEYTAPLVNHHIWPSLQQGIKVVMKGEGVTRRGASLGGSRGRSRSPARSLSPGLRSRSLSPSRRARSRSPSPRRSTSPLRSAKLY